MGETRAGLLMCCRLPDSPLGGKVPRLRCSLTCGLNPRGQGLNEYQAVSCDVQAHVDSKGAGASVSAARASTY